MSSRPGPAAVGVPALLAAAALGVLTLVHLGAQLAGDDGLANVTQWFLMPLLALALFLASRPGASARGAPTARRPRVVRLTLVALAFSWLGDTAPDVVPHDLSFLTMLGFFAVAQVFYVAAFWPLRRHGVVARRPLTALLYLAVLVGLVVACAPGAGVLLPAAVVYGTLLVTMAALATFDRVAAVGGALFLLSDGLIALNAFTEWYALPQHGFWVMLTYVTGQALLAVGVVRWLGRVDDHREPADGAPQVRETSSPTRTVPGTTTSA